MTERQGDESAPDVMEIFEAVGAGEREAALACRVCGCLVAATGEYPRAHWDWHEAANGA